MLGTLAHLSKQASASFQIMSIGSSVSMFGLYFSRIFVWFRSVFKLSNRRPPVYKLTSAWLETSGSLIQAGAWLNKSGDLLFKTGGYLFQSKQNPVSKQAGTSFKQHISSRLVLKTRVLKNEDIILSE